MRIDVYMKNIVYGLINMFYFFKKKINVKNIYIIINIFHFFMNKKKN